MSLAVLDVAVRVGLVLATSFLFGIVALTYFRLRNRRMLLILIGFAIFFVHAVISLPELINEAYMIALDENMHLLIHLIALIFIMLGILKD